MTLVVRTINEKKDHIPPVVSSAVLTFSFDISIAGCAVPPWLEAGSATRAACNFAVGWPSLLVSVRPLNGRVLFTRMRLACGAPAGTAIQAACVLE